MKTNFIFQQHNNQSTNPSKEMASEEEDQSFVMAQSEPRSKSYQISVERGGGRKELLQISYFWSIFARKTGIKFPNHVGGLKKLTRYAESLSAVFQATVARGYCCIFL